MNSAPAATCRSCIVVCFRGVSRVPASVPISTGTQGGRAVVGAVSENGRPVALPHSRCEDSMHAFPWHGPIVIVV